MYVCMVSANNCTNWVANISDSRCWSGSGQPGAPGSEADSRRIHMHARTARTPRMHARMAARTPHQHSANPESRTLLRA
jgi:hypothetical protein